MVTANELYKATFESRSFEVFVLGHRRFRTSDLVDGKFLYEFAVGPNDQLYIYEYDTSNGEIERHLNRRLLLLQRGNLDLPEIFRRSHGFWFSIHHGAVFARGARYQDRNVTLVVTENATYHIPVQFRGFELDRLQSKWVGFEQLFIGKTALLSFLAQFEYDKYIHIFFNASGKSLRYSLPRYKLSFVHNDNTVASEQFEGYQLSKTQSIKDSIPGLASLLILVKADACEKVLIPDGKVKSESKIEVADEFDTEEHYHIYHVHNRFGDLIAMDTTGRLHLAALYASNGCMLVDQRMGELGVDVAADLVRRSWKNQPLSDNEKLKLIEVSLHSQLSCTLRLLCWWVWASSNSLSFLYSLEGEVTREENLDSDFLALDEYRQNRYATRLLPAEEVSLMGTRQPLGREDNVHPGIDENYETPTSDFVSEVEEILGSYCADLPSRTSTFPLVRPNRCSTLEADVYDDLEQSYDTFFRLPRKEVVPYGLGKIRSAIEETKDKRERLETLLVLELSSAKSLEMRLAKLSGRNRTANPQDILRITWDLTGTKLFNHSLGARAQLEVWRRTIDWGVLCVLEDKLHRFYRAACEKNEQVLLTEIQCSREWSPFRYPRWLAFEVEQQLQIRPNQYSIVRQLQETSGSVIQLNMGLGKTRVLVPMLILDLMAKDKIGRIILLGSIKGEALEYYRDVLVASLQHVKIFTMPFRREIPLEEDCAQALSNEIYLCKEHHGCFVVTPQDRNSLLLKQQDQGSAIVEGFSEAFADVIDESDSVLDHKFQLVFALGEQIDLPSRVSRWILVQAFLRILAGDRCDEILHITKNSSMVHRESSPSCAFPLLRLLLPFKDQEHLAGPALCRSLVAAPPYELRWMKEVVSREDRELLVEICSDPNFDGSDNAISF